MNELKIKNLSEELKVFLSINRELETIPERIEILNLTSKLSEKIDNAVSKDKILRIGIVGQVKAGKSSFINALLFNGEDILPKASTPMTAALTVIKYAETPSAEVEFYTKTEWEVIDRNAKEFEKEFFRIAEDRKKKIDKSDNIESIIKKYPEIKEFIADSLKGAYELKQMAKGIDFDNFVGKSENIDGISSISDLVGKLNDYVGANGKFTPITRNTVLKLPIESLKDIELIDTPGVNDPIISRGLATRDFLSKCDSVFLLSTSSQFMGQEDTEFLVNTLPSEGVTNIFVIGSKFDSVLLEEYKKYNGNIRVALKDIYNKLSQQANSSLQIVIASNPNRPIMEKLKSKKVKFISAIAYNIAKKGRNKLDDIEKHIVSQIEKRYNITLDDSTLFDLANIDSIKERDLNDIKSKKDEILAEKLNDIISGQSGEFKNRLEAMEKSILEKIKGLDSANIDELKDKEKNLRVGLNKISSDVEQIFIELSFGIKKNINGLIREIDRNRASYLGMQEKRRSEEVYSHSVSTSSWYNPSTWGNRERIYKTVNYNMVNTLDAVENISKFIQHINKNIYSIWEGLVDIQQAEKELIRVALKGFDLEDENFDKNSIINPVKNALRSITIDRFSMKDKKYREMITESFSSEVRDSKIGELKNRLQNVISDIVDDLEESLKDKFKEIDSILKDKGKNFTNSIEEHMSKDIEKLKSDLENIQEAKERYKVAISEIQKFKERF